MTWLRTLMAAAAALTALSLTPFAHADTAPAQDTVRWSVSPAAGPDSGGPDGRVSLRHVLEPGTTVTDHVVVRNLGETTTTFTVAVGDGRVGADGAFDLAPTPPVDGGTWLDVGGLTDGTVTIGAGQGVVLPVTITAPADATPGDHPAGLVVGHSVDGGVTLTQRIGVRAHLQVAGELVPALEVTQVRTEFSASAVPFATGTLAVTYRVENTGNVRVGALPRLAVAGPFGWGQESVTAAAPTELLPGAAVEQTIEIPVLPLFSATGDLTVDPVVLGDDVHTLPTAVTVSLSASPVAWATVAALALPVLVLTLWLVLRSRRPEAAAPVTANPLPVG